LFLGVLGHDLRNPIGAATMAARHMVKHSATDSNQTRLASQIVSTTERATQILNDLLDITRSAFGTDIPVVKALMDMGQLGLQLAEEMRTISSGRAIDVNIVGETSGEWDRTRMGQVLSNLIGNALQYSPENSPILVTLAGQESDLVISVHNDGAPIPPSKIKTIFDSFTRAQEGQAQREGAMNLGLGLYIAKRIVLAHKGHIDVVSTVEDGTTFTVRLPRH
jgi:signal transduction histidine kinase